ncbi:hypothetical protein EDB89DRAFT_1847074 [Lactarius sanguifluus]|nr:hypothetical protein EDB89DRAFT_1847074 [Lactarius sanguifluus]
MSQLPDDLPARFGHSEGIRKAYSTLLNIQGVISASDIGTTKASRGSHERKLMHVRILGYLILEGPSLVASESVAEDVNSCEEYEDKIDKAGERYLFHYLCIFKKSGGRTPASSLSAYDAFETKKEMTMEMLHQADKPPQDQKEAKRQALARDNFQCIVSGKYDYDMTSQNDDLSTVAFSFSPPRIGVTQCAHIIPSSTNENILDSKDKHASSFWAILGCFGYEDLPDKLKGKGIHSLDNVMTLGMEIHHWFDQLKMWFEAVITLTSEDPRLPLPNPDYLEIHAACCRVAHLSGAGEYMDKVLEDLEDTRVLSEDGSTAHMLSFALQKEAIPVV